jgi:hypothetical protein
LKHVTIGYAPQFLDLFDHKQYESGFNFRDILLIFLVDLVVKVEEKLNEVD